MDCAGVGWEFPAGRGAVATGQKRALFTSSLAVATSADGNHDPFGRVVAQVDLGAQLTYVFFSTGTIVSSTRRFS